MKSRNSIRKMRMYIFRALSQAPMTIQAAFLTTTLMITANRARRANQKVFNSKTIHKLTLQPTTLTSLVTRTSRIITSQITSSVNNTYGTIG